MELSSIILRYILLVIDDQIGQVDNFTADDASFIDFDLEFDETSFRINIGSFSVDIPTVDMPHVFGRGAFLYV